ncbi:hypothetical protein [Parasynechococcus sp.]|uniref:hypothetical protein n=1 Tax=Parasynechococcus sp. TaxID=3101203 RepID=UPI003703C151
MTERVAEEAMANGFDSDWIFVEEPTKTVGQSRSLPRSLALGLLGGLVVGAGSALIVDRRSNRMYSPA